MKLLKVSCLALFLSLCSFVTAADMRDYDFQQERMQVTSDSIIVISSFEKEDHVTAYSHQGTRFWDATFHAKITSWQQTENNVFVFSKGRTGYKTYLTCLDRYTGKVLWERP